MHRNLPDSVDVAVIGAGTGGSAAARVVAAAGHSVVLVERAAALDVGRKVCGNAIGEEGLEAMGAFIEPPGGPEVSVRLTGGTVLFGNASTKITISRGGVILNRLVFGQRLLADAVAAGALLLDECACVGWTDRNEAVVRLRWRDGEEADVRAGIVIDASGYGAVLTRHGGPSFRLDELTRSDVGLAYREIVPLTESLEDAEKGLVVLAPEGAANGYGWVFPMGERLVNVGIGGPLPSVGSDLREAYRRFLAERSDLRLASPIDTGAGMLPLRSPIASAVGDRFMSVGDAACQTNPIHGGGIVPSIMGGGLAGEQAVRALGSGDTSTAGLWNYNVRMMRELGARHAAHDALRRVLDALPPEDFRFLTESIAKTEGMWEVLGMKGARPRLMSALRIVANAAKRPALTRLLVRASRSIGSTYTLYRDYPETPSRFESWFGRVEYERMKLARTLSGRRR